MITTQEIKYFKRQLKNGIPAGEIKNNMLEQGFSKADIDKVFIAKAVNMKSWYLFFGCAFVLAAIIFFNLHLLLMGLGLLMVYINEVKKIDNTNT